MIIYYYNVVTHSDGHWKMPGNVPHAEQKPEMAVAYWDGTGCLQGK